ncbi:proton extrusion protein PcxA [Allocoleopsis franciscana]|uniref:Proton extrusion protein PxcA n=1 Tax=Allocoleopsis franciscana PCC 7113 TaxID=1173027 RepID=K9WML4_9CYAN|nr:proton extrusion protein PcxA [Allocoleopsis franciscana]AFZ21433.1 CemA family [Allocoleopsis franciscana PCC 7113]
MSFQSIFRTANQWFFGTPERALDQAYRAALMIKAIEDEHFNGKKISACSGNYSDSVISYFEADLKKYLKTVKIRLAEFKGSRSVLSSSEANKLENRRNPFNPSALNSDLDNEQQSIIIEKLDFIDKIIKKYSEPERLDKYLVPLSQFQGKQIIPSDLNQSLTDESKNEPRSLQQGTVSKNTAVPDIETVTDKTGVLPRSILRTFNRLQQELDPKAEEEVVKNFRNSKLKTIFSLKFILTIIIVPILTHQIAKTFLVGPIIDSFRSEEQNPAGIFLNLEMEEEAFNELKLFEEELKFKSLIGLAPRITSEEIEEQVKEKATLLAEEFREKGNNSIKNIFADLLSMASFALVIVKSKQEIVILKSFMDDLVYGLSDSAKAFIIILLTDIFVGFHSPHGWEVILKGISQHLGLPENQDFIFLFIATFPVILDSVFKYWIFRYLNRVSPSAVATYRNMNE